MPKVQVNHYYMGHTPGSEIDVPEDEAKRILDSRGGTLVKENTVARKATDTRSESAETREGMTTAKAKSARKSEK